MKAKAERLESAKAQVVRDLQRYPWFRGAGIGVVTKGPGVVVSVSVEGEARARAILEEHDRGVPLRVRVLGTVRKR